MRRRRFGSGARVGQSVGQSASKNMAQLRDLIALTDSRIARTRTAYEAHLQDVAIKDAGWITDWFAMLERYRAAQAEAKKRELSPSEPTDLATDAYAMVARSTQQSFPVDKRTRGDLADLMVRLGRLGYPVDESERPRPTPDVEAPTLADEFLRWTRGVPTPGDLAYYAKVAGAAFLLWKLLER